jgi:hypothetical protein
MTTVISLDEREYTICDCCSCVRGLTSQDCVNTWILTLEKMKWKRYRVVKRCRSDDIELAEIVFIRVIQLSVSPFSKVYTPCQATTSNGE